MTSPSTFQRVERVVAILLAALILVVLFLQARLLYIFPQPDGARWWGDETGQMLELRTELQGGVARLPTGLGSSVAVTNGLVRGNSWLAAGVYGIPALLFSKTSDLVTIGRTVTFALALLVLFTMFAMLRSMQVPRFLALVTVLLFVSTRSFFFGSHVARLDIAAGLALLLLAWYLAGRYQRYKEMRWMPSTRWYFVYGVIIVLLATLSIHLVTLIGMLSLYLLWRFRATPSAIFALAGGVVSVAAILLSVYALSGAPVSMFGPSAGPNQFQSVAGGLPILRPFSRSVQVANILERLHGLLSEAPAFLALLALALGFSVIRRPHNPIAARERWITGAAVVVSIAWLLFQSPALYYYVQVLPLFMVALGLLLGRRRFNIASIVVTILAGLVLSFFAIRDSARAATLSRAIASNNHAALESVAQIIKHDSGVGTHPIVLAQNPAIAWMEQDTNVRLMTAHLVSFPISNAPIGQVLKQLGVRYMLLYAPQDGNTYSLDYHVLQPIADSEGAILFRRVGTLFDVHRDYFERSQLKDTSLMDTLILYRLSSIAR